MSTLDEVIVESGSDDNSRESKEEVPKTPTHDNDNLHNEIPLTWKTKRLCIGSGNVIGKSVIQEFITCAGVILAIVGSILTKTNSYVDAIVVFVIELERKFMHVHPALQRLFLELPNILDPRAKKLATIILMNEFDFIMKEAREIFALKKLIVNVLL